jgi:Sarcoglycan alpha/epsilon
MEAYRDLRLTLAESAVAMGGRRPVRPGSKDGAMVQVGSREPPSLRLQELDRETGPLRRLQSCSYKRTSAEPEFRAAGLAIDWCAFRIFNVSQSASGSKGSPQLPPPAAGGTFVSRSSVQRRSGSRQLLWSLLVPGFIFLVLNSLLAFILMRDLASRQKKFSNNFVDVLFDVLTDCLSRTDVTAAAATTTTTHVVPPSSGANNDYADNNNEVNASSSCHSSSPSVPDLQHVAAGADPRAARASSVQRQTELLRSLARRRDVTPRLQQGWERSSLHSRSRTASPSPSAVTEGKIK